MKNVGPSQEKIDSIISIISIGNFQEALEKTTTLSQKYPGHSILFNISGACYQGLKQYETAAKYYEKAIVIDPNYYKAYYNLGGSLHEMGKLNAAIKSFEKALSIKPDYAEAHNNLGNVFKELDQFDDAIKSFRKATEIKPDYVEAHYNLGSIFQDLNNMQSAIISYKKVLLLKPNFAELHNNLGVIFQGIGEIDVALLHFEDAVRIMPEFAEGHNNLGNVYKELKQLDRAMDCYENAAAFDPPLADAYFNIALILHEQKKIKKAIVAYKKVIAINPDFYKAHNNLGMAFKELEQSESAMKSYEMAISINPSYDEAHNNLGSLLNDLGMPYEAVESYQKAIIINQGNADTHNHFAITLMQLGKLNESIESYKKAIAINPNYEEAHNNLGVALNRVGQFEEAIKSYKKALSIEPEYAEAYYNLGNVMRDLNQMDQAVSNYEYAINLKPGIDYNFGDLFHTKMYLCIWDNFFNDLEELIKKINDNEKVITPFALTSLIDNSQLQLKNSKAYAKKICSQSSTLSTIKNYSNHAKIRIGYFSADFREHPVSDLSAELYELHDRNQFEIYAFSFGPDTQDEMNLRIKAGVDKFYDVRMMSNKDIVILSRSLEIDIAVDLGGFSANHRPEIFAMSLAPSQVGYLGFTYTMGTNFIDYIIADRTVIPKDKQIHYSEKIAYLPDCYMVNDTKITVSKKTVSKKDAGLPSDSFIFCCFNNYYKINPIVFGSWMKILSKVKGSILWIPEGNITAMNNLKKETERHGIDKNRLFFAPRLTLKEDHLNRLQLADLFIDTFPFNAHTTCSDALRVGLPVLTCIGESFTSRVASSLINSVNLPELITTSQEHYESLAIKLATDSKKLKVIKDKLKKNTATSSLYDAELLTKQIETVYLNIYNTSQKGLEFNHIYS